MPEADSHPRRFCVHAEGVHAPGASIVEDVSFEAAALAWLEDFHPADQTGELSLIVRALDDGGEYCLRVDLHSGETSPCP